MISRNNSLAVTEWHETSFLSAFPSLITVFRCWWRPRWDFVSFLSALLYYRDPFVRNNYHNNYAVSILCPTASVRTYVRLLQSIIMIIYNLPVWFRYICLLQAIDQFNVEGSPTSLCKIGLLGLGWIYSGLKLNYLIPMAFPSFSMQWCRPCCYRPTDVPALIGRDVPACLSYFWWTV